MSTQYYAPLPPAGSFPYQSQPQGYYYVPQQYQQQPLQYPVQPPYPQQATPYPYGQPSYPSPPPSQGWQQAPHASELQAQPPQKPYNPEAIWHEFNDPPDPQYGIPESERPAREAEDAQQHIQSGHKGNGERGLGATLVGGAGGAFLGHKLEHGALGTLGGLAVGAIAANAYEHHEKKKKEERRQERAFDEGYEDGEDRPHHHHSRDIDDQEDYSDDRCEEDEDFYRPRHHHHHHYDDDYYQDDYREDYYDRRDNY